MDDRLFETEQLAVGYGRRVLIGEIRLCVEPGEIVVLIGANGTGKTTLLRSVIRQLRPLGGRLLLKGSDLASMERRTLARTMSVLMTDRAHPELMTCREAVESCRYPYTGVLGILSERDHKKVREAMARMQVEELAEQPFSQISDGQRQRVLLARAVCQEPELLVLDEPTSFLDVRHKLGLLALLRNLVREERIGVLMSLHELDLAQRVADRVVCIRGGRADRVGTPDEVFTADYIPLLFGLEAGSYEPCCGSVELPRIAGEPQVFVLAGGGSGCGVFRRLQREGVPFSAGILSENDLDYPAAHALAAEVISVPAFSVPGEEAYRRAAARMDVCGSVLCPLQSFGPANEQNRRLREYAAKRGYLRIPL